MPPTRDVNKNKVVRRKKPASVPLMLTAKGRANYNPKTNKVVIPARKAPVQVQTKLPPGAIRSGTKGTFQGSADHPRKGTSFGELVSQLSRGRSAVAGAVESGIKSQRHGLNPSKLVAAETRGAIRGAKKNDKSWSDVARTLGARGKLKSALGAAGDFVLDPANLVPVGKGAAVLGGVSTAVAKHPDAMAEILAHFAQAQKRGGIFKTSKALDNDAYELPRDVPVFHGSPTEVKNWSSGKANLGNRFSVASYHTDAPHRAASYMGKEGKLYASKPDVRRALHGDAEASKHVMDNMDKILSGHGIRPVTREAITTNEDAFLDFEMNIRQALKREGMSEHEIQREGRIIASRLPAHLLDRGDYDAVIAKMLNKHGEHTGGHEIAVFAPERRTRKYKALLDTKDVTHLHREGKLK